MEFKDYYQILGVDRHADQKTIAAAFRRLARRYHPDINKTREAEEKFKEINEAYQVLGDPERRARYDQMYDAYRRGGVDWQQLFGAPGAPGGWTVTFGEGLDLEDLLAGMGFSDFFARFFGADFLGSRRPGRPGRRRVGVQEGAAAPAGPTAAVSITLEEAFAGTRKSVVVHLNGTSRRFDVSIPPGVRDGQRIRLPGALDGQDVYLVVQVQSHPLFVRQDDHILVEVPVTPSEAVLGARIEVPTLDGKVEMVLPPGTQNGQTFRLRGLGMPRREGGRGDQLVRVKVVLPTDLTPRERQLYEELARLRRDNPRAAMGCR
ncbi:MAG: DnaJ C-terminal domain-containing protein [Armatimonadota bacterium]|nr:DnaJ C-terminal domain-containing protein [Armatimonadota bacterium]MDR7403244.1 DnaJ C-terminal domain-containing protein [Armatimonadota bacterium]